MNMKLVSELAMLGFFATFKLVGDYADSRFESKRALDMAVAEHTSEDIEKYVKAKHDIEVKKAVLSREKKGIAEALASYKQTSGFASKKNHLYSEGEKALQEFKANLGYEDKLLSIEQDMEDSISAFKASVNYDDVVEGLDKEIADATEKWEAQEKLCELADDNISDTALKLRHAAEEAKNETIKKATEKKNALEAQLAAEKEKFEKKKRESIRSMEEKIAKEKRRIDEKTSKAVTDLEKDLEDAKSRITADIQAKRTEEEADCVLMAQDNEEFVRVQDTNDRTRASAIAAETPQAERLAWWLKSHGWTKGGVIFVGSLPIIPAGYLIYRYGKFVFSVASHL